MERAPSGQAHKGAGAVDANKPEGFLKALANSDVKAFSSEKEKVSVGDAAFFQTRLKIGRVYQKTKKSPFF